MRDEIAATVFFVTRLARRHGQLSQERLDEFAGRLSRLLLDAYQAHWYRHQPCRGQAFRCIRINHHQQVDPLLERACAESRVDFAHLGLPREMTIWVDPLQVCCRFGEKNPPFPVADLAGRARWQVAQQISRAVDRATADYGSGSSSDEETYSREPRVIPKVRNPKSVYQVNTLALPTPHPWLLYSRREGLPEGHPHASVGPSCVCYKGHRVTPALAGPRLDRYHWVNANH
ncbi:protein BTG4 [Tachyglossus aculeatus]|uniref:protein BTG4 n=1 Tax=Tachyglossus aculeatus TaxID=9261 RepID=UPI0018F75401|nr:protein BTG4 [Tachyglossus aculeatus]